MDCRERAFRLEALGTPRFPEFCQSVFFSAVGEERSVFFLFLKYRTRNLECTNRSNKNTHNKKNGAWLVNACLAHTIANNEFGVDKLVRGYSKSLVVGEGSLIIVPKGKLHELRLRVIH